jgi:hypothetical protein
MTMARKLSELTKAKMAQTRHLKKEQAELGPLFAAQAQVEPLAQVVQERRYQTARCVQHIERLSGVFLLDTIRETVLRQKVQALVSPDRFAALQAQRRNYPHQPNTGDAVYGIMFWSEVLTTIQESEHGQATRQ